MFFEVWERILKIAILELVISLLQEKIEVTKNLNKKYKNYIGCASLQYYSAQLPEALTFPTSWCRRKVCGDILVTVKLR